MPEKMLRVNYACVRIITTKPENQKIAKNLFIKRKKRRVSGMNPKNRKFLKKTQKFRRKKRPIKKSKISKKKSFFAAKNIYK